MLLPLLGLTGFAIAQPLLAVAGEDPTLFIFAGVEGSTIVAFALIVAFVPPLLLWGVVRAVGAVDRRAGEAVFVLIAACLAGVTAIQWVKTGPGVDARWVLATAGVAGAVAFGVALVRLPAVALWTRFTAVLPPVAVVLLLVASPSGDLLRARSAGAAADGPRTGVPASVVFVMLDELPTRTILGEDGNIDPVRFPNLAELASGATWYRDYTVMANQTLRSVPSILSGTVPDGSPPIWTSHPDNLFSLLAPTHELDVIEPVTKLCGFADCDIDGAEGIERGGLRSLLGQMVDVWSARVALAPIPEVDVDQFAAVAEADAEEIDAERKRGLDRDSTNSPGYVADFVDALRSDPSDPPSLAYLHLLVPHQPWTHFPDGSPMRGTSNIDLKVEGIDVTDWDMALLEQAHTFQAMWADRLVGEVVDGLRAKGTYDETLVVVTADHGLSFEEEMFPDLRVVGPDTLSQVAYVPLIVKSPGQREGTVDDSNLMALDLLPTIADQVGVELPWAAEGHVAGSPEVAARGESKLFDDDDERLGVGRGNLAEFDSADHRPSVVDRHVAPTEAGAHSLAGLLRGLGGDEWLGERVVDLAVEGEVPGVVTIPALARNRSADADAVARLSGEAEGLDVGDTVLLVVDGVVETGSPVLAGGRLGFFVPPEVSWSEDTSVSLLVVGDDGYVEVALGT